MLSANFFCNPETAQKKWSVLNKQPCHILLSYIFTEFKTHVIQYQFFHGGGGVG